MRLEQFASQAGLRHTSGGQIDIGPTREAVLQIPGGLAVANQNKRVHDQKPCVNSMEKKDSRMTVLRETGYLCEFLT